MSSGLSRFQQATHRSSNQVCFFDRDQVVLATSLACLNMYNRGDLPGSYVTYPKRPSAVHRKLIELGCFDEVYDTTGRAVGVDLTEDIGVFYAVMAVSGGYCPPYLAADKRNLIDPRTGEPIAIKGEAEPVVAVAQPKKMAQTKPRKPRKPVAKKPATSPPAMRRDCDPVGYTYAGSKSRRRSVSTPRLDNAPVNVGNFMLLCNSHIPEPKPNFGPLRSTATEYGWIVWMLDDAEVPAWLRPIAAYAQKHDCQLVEFDSANPEHPAFDTYVW